jgi:mannosyltransferase
VRFRASLSNPRSILLAILTLAAVLRFHAIGRQSLWYDEVLTVYSARAPLSNLVTTVRTWESSPPGYFLLMNTWVRIFGDSDTSLRIPSAIFGVASISLLFLLARRVFQDHPSATTIGLVAALVLALSRYHIAYSQEARPYSMAMFLALVSCHALSVLLRAPSTRWPQVVYVLSTGAMLWVQPFTVFVLVAQSLFLAITFIARWNHTPRADNSNALRRWITLQAAAVLLFGPWLPFMLQVASAGHAWMSKHPPVAEAILAYTDGIPTLIVFTVLALFATYHAARQRDSTLSLALLLAIIPVAIPATISLLLQHPIFTPRYGIASLIGLALLAGYGAVSISLCLSRSKTTLAAIVCLLVLPTLPNLATDFRQGTNAQFKPDNRAAAALIEDSAFPGDGVWSPDMHIVRPFQYYLHRTDLRLLNSLSSSDAPLPTRLWLIRLQPPRSSDSSEATLLHPFIQKTPYRLISQHALPGVLVYEVTSATPQ